MYQVCCGDDLGSELKTWAGSVCFTPMWTVLLSLLPHKVLHYRNQGVLTSVLPKAGQGPGYPAVSDHVMIYSIT